MATAALVIAALGVAPVLTSTGRWTASRNRAGHARRSATAALVIAALRIAPVLAFMFQRGRRRRSWFPVIADRLVDAVAPRPAETKLKSVSDAFHIIHFHVGVFRGSVVMDAKTLMTLLHGEILIPKLRAVSSASLHIEIARQHLVEVPVVIVIVRTRADSLSRRL